MKEGDPIAEPTDAVRRQRMRDARNEATKYRKISHDIDQNTRLLL